MRSFCQLLLLAHAVCAITGPRVENDFDRRRQSPHPGFNEHQTRFGLNSPLQSFPPLPAAITSPPPNIPFQQTIFPSQQQQPQYVPQFNNHIPPINNLPLQNTNLQSNFQFNPQPSINPNNFQTQPHIRQIPQQTQNLLQPSIPTLPTFQNGIPLQQNRPTFQTNIPTSPITLSQRPTQQGFLPTISTQSQPTNQPIFSHPNPISIQPAPNLAPQNFNLNGAQLPFQPSLGQDPIFSNGQNSQIQDILEQQSKENLEKLRELQERARIIQKHQEFVQKQQQKQQEKVEKLHEEFIKKQASKSTPSYSTTEAYEDYWRGNVDRRRPILPHEKNLFQQAVEQYEKDHPTTSTTTTTTTTTTTPPPTPRYRPRPKPKSRNPPQDRNKQKLYNDIKSLLQESETKGFDDSLRAKSAELLRKPDILKQLKIALAENPEDFSEKNFSSREISLNGQKYEVIRTTNPNLIPQGAISADGSNFAQIMAAAQLEAQKESRVSIEELTKGILPPGANYELIKHAENGKLEEVKVPNEIQNKKKVTFVFLEEQDDGSFKVKGVKANGQQTEDGPEVENILNKIKKGEIQLPGQTKISNSVYASTASPPITEPTDYVAASSHLPPTYSTYVNTINHGTTGHTIPVTHTTAAPAYESDFQPSRSTQTHSQTYFPSSKIVTSTERYFIQSSTPSVDSRNSINQSPRITFPSSTYATTPYRSSDKDLIVIGSSTIAPSIKESSRHAQSSALGLVEILKENGLFATAKYLRQSGLDTILNETGPYTIFVPTDKAFRTLLVQLGGPDKAEEKFRDNPRLLSGLLLHHVIPGAFDIASLQDEMTGVSLAGTQLRVNQYDLHDAEWNEVKVTTINGARVLDEKKDIHIPQGIAHAVDRVMFPLPVGDLVQTLQADRDRRFTTFVKAIQVSGFAETLTESKTFTVFAPTDAVFARLSPAELAKFADKAGAKALVARHVLPGTLYSAGMRYYQLKNSMEDSKPLTLQKSSGRIKVNNAQVITHNIPATNGVIHAVDALL